MAEPAAPEPAARSRRSFGPVVLLGLASGVLAAVAGARPWVLAEDATAASDPLGLVADAGEMPLASALSLVVLACWGVLLVTRRRVRRVVAVLGLLASLGLVATAVVGWVTLPEQVLEAMLEQSPGDDAAETTTSGWFWGAALGSLGSAVATALAALWCPGWPEMGSRYDAPGDTAPGASGEAGQGADTSHLDLWKAMDEGRDPTA
jgi:uncharacterized membrane protein (TIGR02234 family)